MGLTERSFLERMELMGLTESRAVTNADRTMAEYYSKEAVVEFIRSYRHSTDVAFHMEDHLYEITAADVRPVVRGKWKKRMEEKETLYYKSFTPIWSCSECGTEYDPSLCMAINFCPNCGADMREES